MQLLERVGGCNYSLLAQRLGKELHYNAYNVSYRKNARSNLKLNLNLVNTSQMLIPLSHWTCTRGVEASFVTAKLEVSGDVIQLLGRLSIICKWRSPAEWVVGMGKLPVLAHCLSRYAQ